MPVVLRRKTVADRQGMAEKKDRIDLQQPESKKNSDSLIVRAAAPCVSFTGVPHVHCTCAMGAHQAEKMFDVALSRKGQTEPPWQLLDQVSVICCKLPPLTAG